MPSTCIFQLDRRNGVYFSGETINGRLHLKTSSDKSNVAVYIRFHGEGKVNFEDGSSNGTNYCGNETYLDARTTVFAGGTLPAGTHTYTICIPLPLACPSTCKLKAGKIRYELSVIIDRSYKFNNVFKHPITLIQQLDLNHASAYMVPMKTKVTSYTSFFQTQPLFFTLILPHGGYVPGQNIDYLLYVDNQTSKVRQISHCVSLKQIYTFKALRPGKRTHTQSTILAQVRNVAVCEKRKTSRHSGSLGIPSAPPTCLQDYIISVGYVLNLKIDNGFCKSDLKLSLPIALGTVPIMRTLQPAAGMLREQRSSPASGGSTLGDQPPRYEDCADPNFWTLGNVHDFYKSHTIPVDATASVYNHLPEMHTIGSAVSNEQFQSPEYFTHAVNSSSSGYTQDNVGYSGDCGGGGGVGGGSGGGGGGDSGGGGGGDSGGGCGGDSGGGGGGGDSGGGGGGGTD